MRTYVIRRLLLFIPTLLILSMLVFFSVRLLPGDLVDILTAETQFGVSSEEEKERLRAMMGLDVPAHVAYVRWVSGILLHGTLGPSLQRGNAPVEGKILSLPYAVFISAGNDGTMALAAIRRIANGYPFKEVQEPIIATGDLTEVHLNSCRELGLAMALGLEMDLF